MAGPFEAAGLAAQRILVPGYGFRRPCLRQGFGVWTIPSPVSRILVPGAGIEPALTFAVKRISSSLNVLISN
jgi:hypothetical protein